MQMAARVNRGGGLRCQRNAGRRLCHQQRLPELVDGLLRVLAVDVAGVVPVLRWVECLVDRVECFVGCQRQRLLAGCGIGQTLCGLLCGRELPACLMRVEQRAARLCPCGGREQ